MKTLNLKFTALAVIAVLLGTVFFTSCSKNEVYEPQNVTELKPELRRGIIGNLKKYADFGGDNYGCLLPNGNCYPDIVVIGIQSSLFTEVFSVIEQGHKPTTSRVFEQNYSTLNSYIDAASLDNVINLSQDVEYKYNTSQKKHYLLFKSDEKINIVYQFQLK